MKNKRTIKKYFNFVFKIINSIWVIVLLLNYCNWKENESKYKLENFCVSYLNKFLFYYISVVVNDSLIQILHPSDI